MNRNQKAVFEMLSSKDRNLVFTAQNILAALRGPDNDLKLAVEKAKFTAPIRHWFYGEKGYHGNGFAPRVVPQDQRLTSKGKALLLRSAARDELMKRRGEIGTGHFLSHITSALRGIVTAMAPPGKRAAAAEKFWLGR